MKHDDSLPLVMPARRRGWADIILLRPLGTSPHTALVLTRRGQLVSVIPGGSTRVLSDYLDLPCEVIEVDGRERRLILVMPLESQDSGRFFQAEVQIVYQVLQPERIALELDDAMGEFEKLIRTAISSAAHSVRVDQTSLLNASINELFEPGSTIQNRASTLGLTIKRVDVEVDISEADRIYSEQLKELQRERPMMWRFYCESLDPRTSFEIQVGGFYKSRRRLVPGSGPQSVDELEFALRNAIERAIRRVAVEYTPKEYQAAAHAMTEALVSSPVLLAELASAEVDLLRPAVEIQPARLMLVDSMRSRLALPAPEDADATDAFHWMLPPPIDQEVSAANPAAYSLPDTTQMPNAAPDVDISNQDDEYLWEDSPQEPPEEVPLDTTLPPEPQHMPNWLVDRALFGAQQSEAALEEHIPVWLHGWDRPEDQEPADDPQLAQMAAASPAQPDPLSEEMDADEEEPIPEVSPIATQNVLSAPVVYAKEPGQLSTSYANGSTLQQITSQVAQWLRLLRSDGDEEFERWASVIIEQPARLHAILTGLIRDPQVLAGADQAIYQQALADELRSYVVIPTPPPWLAEATASSTATESELPEWLKLR
jgi:hypothetical protein